MKRVSASTLSDLLGLPGMVVTAYAIEKQEGREVLHIFCQHENEVAGCPDCSGISTRVHESDERCIRRLDIWGKATYVHFPARRFECKKCKKPFSEGLSWIEEKRRTSTSDELHIDQQSQHSDIEAVAKREGLHPEMVQSIFGRWAKRAEKKQERSVVRCLGIDEISLRKGHQHFAMVLSDLERHCILAVLPERSRKALEGWLEGLEEGQKKAIRVAVMDRWGPYRGIVQTKLPHAENVADRFHVMKQLNDAIAKIRRSLQTQADKESDELLKGTRWILVRNRADLKPEEEAKLQAALSAFPELRRAYLLKEKFATIANRIHNRQQAERFLRAWIYEAQATGLISIGEILTDSRKLVA